MHYWAVAHVVAGDNIVTNSAASDWIGCGKTMVRHLQISGI